jgi:hypothetical protein
MRRWPWVTIVTALIVILNPIGLEIVSAAIEQSSTDWLRAFWLHVTIAGASILLVLGFIEIWLRSGSKRVAPKSGGSERK